MSKLRSLSTSFWSDPFIEDLSVSEKLLFIYLITNEKTNMLGIYELSIKKISFETGIDKATVQKALKRFETINKVKYVDNHIILINFLKHQHFNTNMKKSAIDCYLNLPETLKIQGVKIDKTNPLEAFESLCEGFGMVRKVEVEVEDETKGEVEDEEKKQKKIYRKFKHLKLTVKEFNKLSETYKKEQIDNILDKIENYSKNKNYTSLYLTCNNWLKKEAKEKPKPTAASVKYLNYTQ